MDIYLTKIASISQSLQCPCRPLQLSFHFPPTTRLFLLAFLLVISTLWLISNLMFERDLRNELADAFLDLTFITLTEMVALTPVLGTSINIRNALGMVNPTSGFWTMVEVRMAWCLGILTLIHRTLQANC